MAATSFRVFGVNSDRVKPGPDAAPEGKLLIWEREWHWVFDGLVYGTPRKSELADSWEPLRPPKLSNIEELDQERVAEWDAKLHGPEGWVRRSIPVRMGGRDAEPEVWKQILEAKTAEQIRSAYRASSFWLNPEANLRPWVRDLEEHAEGFLTSKSYRYPGSERPSSVEKCVIHFARAMAGIEIGISPARAIDRIRTMKHGDECACMMCEIARWKSIENPYRVE
jgi:hypothetical protein